MSALVVDTSSWIAWFAGGGSPLIGEALEEGRVHLPVVVAAELLSGRLDGSERADLQDFLTWFETWFLRRATPVEETEA